MPSMVKISRSRDHFPPINLLSNSTHVAALTRLRDYDVICRNVHVE